MMTSLRGLTAAAALAALTAGVGCVPLSEHRKLEARFEDQQKFVDAHRNEVKEFEKRERFLTLQLSEKQKENELLKTRLQKSEVLRAEQGSTMPAAAAPEKAITLGGGFVINPKSGGIVLEHDILFSQGKSELKPSGKAEIDKLIAKLNSAEFANYAVRVDGHTDSDPVSKSKATNVDNWGLSAHRALVVLRYMESHGISSGRLYCAGFGSQKPLSGSIAPAEMPVKAESHKHTKKGHGSKSIESRHDDPTKAQNRRVEIVLFQQ
jgi:outer membrane protein OmpA-like peptidoglycan-associated protein